MTISLIGYSVSALAYIVFLLVLLTDKHRGKTKTALLIAVFASFVWASTISLGTVYGKILQISIPVETLKNISWILLLFGTLQSVYFTRDGRSAVFLLAASKVILGAVLIYSFLLAYNHFLSINYSVVNQYVIQLLLALCGIVLVEQVYRNIRLEQRWAIKYLCLGLLGSYLFNFYMYSDAIITGDINHTVWQARGYVEAILVPLLAISISRDPLWSPEIFISRRIIFHTSTLLASSLYLVIMGGAGIYATQYGGTWGDVLQILFVFFTLLGFVILLVSRRLRARIRVFVNKHFYPYKYDYREEWLRFINTISFSNEQLNLKTIKAIAQIINSPSGQLWLRKANGSFECVETLDMAVTRIREPSEGSLCRFLSENEFVISVDEFYQKPEVYLRLGVLELPSWIAELNPWLIVPLIHINKLIGFIVLSHSSENVKHFNWEDSDLLKTAARQVASYIAQQEDSIALAEAKQFENFNKLSTYIVHDIKNLVAQLSLIVTNAERHRNNPLFMEDVITTVGNTVSKMNKMLDLVNEKRKLPQSDQFDIIVLLEELIRLREKSQGLPIPQLGCESTSCMVKADSDQLLSVFGHLVQNAQDATADDGSIQILQSVNNGQVVVKFIDSGSGMDEEFIRTSLFKPFRSTKGKGMGIGVYEAREIINALGGSIEVESQVNRGTCFAVTLPLAWIPG
jgi:putative PEP-CTERM system histidine kinase